MTDTSTSCVNTAWPPLTIPVCFHVLHYGDRGKVDEATIDAQISHLNHLFVGGSISFFLSSLDYTDNKSWFDMDIPGPEHEKAFETLGRNVEICLNLYTANLFRPEVGQTVYGHSSKPWDFHNFPAQDGVVVHHGTLPGRNPGGPVNEGDVCVHETGHWLGLIHTFTNAGVNQGDYVDDTPFQPVRSSRGRFGEGFVGHNIMDSGSDAQRNELTPGQFERIRQDMLPRFRPELLS